MGKIIGLIILIATGFALWDGFVLTIVWNWFMPRTFGLPALTIAQAIGVSLVAEVITGSARGALDDEEPLVTLGIHVALGVLALVIGFFVQLFI